MDKVYLVIGNFHGEIAGVFKTFESAKAAAETARAFELKVDCQEDEDWAVGDFNVICFELEE